MTRLGWAGLAAYVAGMVFLACAAGTAVEHGARLLGLGFYGTSTLLTVAGSREHERGRAARATAVRAGRPRPGRAHRGDAVAIARAEVARICGCDRWWISFGTDHDAWCPNYQRSETT